MFFQPYGTDISKMVFNSSLPIDKTVQIPGASPNLIFPIAYISKNKNPNLKCDISAFIEKEDPNNLNIFKNCEPYETPKKYLLKK